MAKRIQKGDSVESIVMGDEPLWNTNILITDDYLSGYIIKHTNWCNYHWDMRDYRKAVLEYLKNKKNKNMFNTISKKNSDDFIFREIGNYCRMFNLGCPLSDKIIGFMQTKLKMLSSTVDVYQDAEPTEKVDIQQRIRDKTKDLIDTIEEKVDHFVSNLSNDKPYSFDALTWLTSIGVKGVHTAEIIKLFTPRKNELEVALNGDKELMEGYAFLGKAKTRKYLEFNTSILDACNVIAENKRKPRKKKKVSPEKLVSKLKYMVEDPNTKIKSIDPRKIISANILITYNTKTKRASFFSSKAGLSIKGTSIIGFDEPESSSKTLKKEKYIFDLTKQVKDVSSVYKSVKSKEKPAKSRINTDVLLLQAIKL
jgi:hypothetical protein